MFEQFIEQSNEVVWALTYLNADCEFSASVAKLRQALINSLLGIEPEPQAENIPPEIHQAPAIATPALILSPDAERKQQEQEEKARFIAGVRDAVEQICVYLKQVRWNKHVRPLIGGVQAEGEPFLIQHDEPAQIIQMKQWINALYHLEQGLRVIESKKLTSHLKRYAETKSKLYLAGTLAWNSLELKQLYQDIITSIHRSFYLITHVVLDFNFIFEEELQGVSAIWDYWTAASPSTMQTADVLNLSEKIGFFLGLLLDQLRPDEHGGVNYSLVTRAAAMLPELKRYFDYTPFVRQKSDLIALSKRFLGDFGFDDRGLVKHWIELIYDALEASSDQKENLGDLPILADGPARRFFKLLFTEQKKQEKHLDDLQETALKLKHALSDLHDGGILAVINYIHIARHGWDLAGVIQGESSVLRDEVQALVSEGIIHIRDYRLPKIIAFVDKLEEVFMFDSGLLSKPFMLMFDRVYRDLVSQLMIPKLSLLLSSAFLIERFRLADRRHQYYAEHEQFVSHVLKPCLARLTAANTTKLTRNWPKFYRPLQKILEVEDPYLSNELLKFYRFPHRNVVKFEAFFAKIKVRLNALQKTHQLLGKLNLDVIQHTLLVLAKAETLRECQGLTADGILFTPEKFGYDAAENQFAKFLNGASSEDDVTFICERRLGGYLITDISEDAPVRKMAAALKRLREALKRNLDADARTESSLNLVHIAEMLDYLEQSCVVLESLCDKAFHVSFVVQTIVLFRTWVFASAVLPSYYLEAKERYLSESTGLYTWFKKQTRYYDVSYREPKDMPVQDLSFYFMNALEIFPMHMNALHAKQEELSEKSVLATHKKAREGAVDFSKMMEASAWLVGLLYEYSAIWRLFSNAKSMGKTFLDETYKIATKNGLNDLVERFFFSLLHKIDLYEIKLGLKPGVLSEKVERVIWEFLRGLLEPLGWPSNTYIKLMSNRAPYDRRFRSLPDTAMTHQAYFRKKYSEEFFDGLVTKARGHCIDEAMEREFKRLEKQGTGLQHATNAMYLKAFKLFVRPIIDREVKGENVEKQVCEQLESNMQKFHALHDQDYRRLDVILEVIADLKKYIAVPADASLFETQGTYQRKREKVERLAALALPVDESMPPGERIKKIRRFMKQDNFQENMLAYANPDWFTFEAFKRAILWLLECVGLYTPDCRTNYNNLVRSVQPDTHYATSPLIGLSLFNKPVPSHERVKKVDAVFSKFGYDRDELLASCHEPT